MEVNININKHFTDFVMDWNCYEYFLLGGYGSSKSYGTAIKLVLKAVSEKRNILVIRQVKDTHKDSTYADVKDAIEICGLDEHFISRKSPLEIECLSNQTKFIFRGLDDWRKLKSIKNVSIVWIEEGEGSMEAYKELKDRMRALGKKVHIIVTSNPKPRRHWIYKRFITEMGITEKELYEKRKIIIGDVYLHHSTYKDNKYLNERWIKNLEAETDPTLIKIKREGQFGSDGIKVLNQIEKMDEDKMHKIIRPLVEDNGFVGLDWGFTVSYNACVRMVVDDEDELNKKLYLYYEYYTRKKTNAQIREDLDEFRHTKELITSDSAEPKTIREFREKGFNITKCKKFNGSVRHGIKKLQGFHKIYISSSCINAWNELDELMFKTDKYGDILEDEFNIDSHVKDAMVYGLDKYEHVDLKDYRGYASEFYSRGEI